MRALLSYGVAFIILVVIGLWMVTGTLVRGGAGPGLGEKPIIGLVEQKDDANKPSKPAAGEIDPAETIAQREAKTEGASAPVRSVEVKTFIAQPMAIEVPLRGQTKAKATVTSMAETTGTVATVNITKGQVVKTGDLLCTLDPETRKTAVAQANASLAQANATVAQAQADYDTNQTLIAKGAATPNSARQLGVALSAAKASVAAAQAGVDSATTELGRTNIYAKTGGIVSDPIATVGTILNPTIGVGTCATIVQMDPLVFAGNIPEARIGYAKLGLSASITTVTGEKLTGKVTYIAPVADPATRTFPAEIEVANPNGAVQAGLSAEAIVNVGTAPAQLLPQSVLTLDDDGAMGIRAVEDSKVKFYPVTIVKDAREGMYVTGLPLKLDVITVGQEFVKAGDTVKAVQDTGTATAKPAGTDGAQT